MEPPSRAEQTGNKDVSERNSTFNIFRRARASINNPSFIKTDSKDLLRLVQWLFFIVSQSKASKILTARNTLLFKVLLRVTSVSQPSFYFLLISIHQNLQIHKRTLRQLSYMKTYGLYPPAFVECITSFNFLVISHQLQVPAKLQETSGSLFHSATY